MKKPIITIDIYLGDTDPREEITLGSKDDKVSCISDVVKLILICKTNETLWYENEKFIPLRKEEKLEYFYEDSNKNLQLRA